MIQLGLAEIFFEVASFPPPRASDLNALNLAQPSSLSTSTSNEHKFNLLELSRNELVKLIRIFRLYSEAVLPSSPRPCLNLIHFHDLG